MPKALILGDDTRAFLACVRSLGRQGIVVDVVPTNWASPALSSRYIRRAHRFADINIDIEAWQSDLESLLRLENYDFVLPCTDNMVVALHMSRHHLPEEKLAIVNKAVFEIFFDKIKTRELANSCGVPIATGCQLGQNSDAASLVSKIGLPLAIKTRSSVFERAVGKRHAVSICRDVRQVEAALEKIDVTDEFLAESLFNGGGVGLSVLAKDGRVLQAFQHERVNESLAGKGSFYRKSVPIDPNLLGYVTSMCDRTALTGLAMFEFCRNKQSGETILLEVNARPWGSLPLAIAAGVDFPYLYYQLLVSNIEEPRCNPIPQVFCRNVTADLNSHLDALSSFSSGSPKSKVMANLATRIVGLGRLFFGIDRLDVSVSDDPAPAAADWAEYWQAWRNRLEPRLKWLNRHYQKKERQRFNDLIELKKPIRCILVLCRGNICRSPYAEARLSRILVERGSSARVISAGTMPKPGRPVPQEGLDAAKTLGLDLGAHKSTYVADLDLEKVDLILHFDPIIETEFRRVMGLNTPPLFNLAYFVTNGAPATKIIDPINSSPEVFENTYKLIDASLNNLPS